jgi:capsular polysaccharide biosynthesis protein
MLPFFSPTLFILLGAICAALLAVIFGYIADYYDPSVRTPGQVMDELNIPVLASIPVATS